MRLRSQMLGSITVFCRPDDGTGAAGDAGGSNTGTPDKEATGAAPAGGTTPAAGEAGGGDDDAAGGEGDGEPAGGTPAQQQPDPNAWKDKELARKHRQLKKEREERQRVETELADARALLERTQTARQPAAGADDGAGATERQPATRQERQLTQEDVQAEAGRIVARQTYDQQCNAVTEKGAKEYDKTWAKAIDTLEQLGGFTQADMEQILATDDPSKVLHDLGTNPDEYHRVMELPPAKRFAEMVKIAIKPTPRKKTVSDAPEPVDTLRGGGGSSASTELKDDLTDDEWYKRRGAQKRAKWEKERGGRAA